MNGLLEAAIDQALQIRPMEREAHLFRNLPHFIRTEDGLLMPVPKGSAEQIEDTIGSMSFSWATVATTPGMQRLQIVQKALLKQLVIRISGTYDQSVGAETMATEGNPVLWDEIRLNVDGRTIRPRHGAVLYEMNKLVEGGSGPKVDPTTGVAAGKVFSCVLNYDMGFLDADEQAVREKSYLDLSQYANVFLEVVPGPFNRYVSGNTQAAMAATVSVSGLFVIGPRRVPQAHHEMLLTNVIDMNVTGNDRPFTLTRSKLLLRGVWLRVGNLTGTPVITATTPLTNLGVKGKLVKGGSVEPKVKQAVGYYSNQVGYGRNNIALTAGHLWLDFAHNKKLAAHLIGDTLADLNLIIDTAALANYTMQVRQSVLTR
jgi:hypothetical protein